MPRRFPSVRDEDNLEKDLGKLSFVLVTQQNTSIEEA
jgi:hypothetical protein